MPYPTGRLDATHHSTMTQESFIVELIYRFFTRPF